MHQIIFTFGINQTLAQRRLCPQFFVLWQLSHLRKMGSSCFTLLCINGLSCRLLIACFIVGAWSSEAHLVVAAKVGGSADSCVICTKNKSECVKLRGNAQGATQNKVGGGWGVLKDCPVAFMYETAFSEHLLTPTTCFQVKF